MTRLSAWQWVVCERETKVLSYHLDYVLCSHTVATSGGLPGFFVRAFIMEIPHLAGHSIFGCVPFDLVLI